MTDLADWDNELAVVSKDLETLKAAHGKRKLTGAKALVARKVSIIQLTVHVDRNLERVRRLVEREVLLLPREKALVHGAKLYLERCQAFLRQRSDLLARGLWLKLIKTQLLGVGDKPGEAATADDLIALAVRQGTSARRSATWPSPSSSCGSAADLVARCGARHRRSQPHRGRDAARPPRRVGPTLSVLDPHRMDPEARLAGICAQHAFASPRAPRLQRGISRPVITAASSSCGIGLFGTLRRRTRRRALPLRPGKAAAVEQPVCDRFPRMGSAAARCAAGALLARTAYVHHRAAPGSHRDAGDAPAPVPFPSPGPIAGLEPAE